MSRKPTESDLKPKTSSKGALISDGKDFETRISAILLFQLKSYLIPNIMCTIPLILGISIIGIFDPDKEVIKMIIEDSSLLKWAYFLRLLVFLQVPRINSLII